jgi:hypothetical protein
MERVLSENMRTIVWCGENALLREFDARNAGPVLLVALCLDRL